MSFESQIVEFRPKLLRYAMSLCHNVDTAEDLVQTTLLSALTHRDKFATGTNLHAWLSTILRNTYFTAFRKKGREIRESDLPEGSMPVRSVSGNQESAFHMLEVEAVIEKHFPETWKRHVQQLIQGNSYVEMAKAESVAEGTIKSRVNRLRVFLRDTLENSATPLGRPKKSAKGSREQKRVFRSSAENIVSQEKAIAPSQAVSMRMAQASRGAIVHCGRYKQDVLLSVRSGVQIRSTRLHRV